MPSKMNVKSVEGDSKPAIFLDRDGVLIETIIREGVPHPPATLSEVCIVDVASRTLFDLGVAGYLRIVVTNQPDVARGTQTRANVEMINDLLMRAMPIDRVYVCYHDNADHCACRKPAPGMLSDAAGDFGIDLARSYMIGDRWSDVEAGRNAGCRTILLNRSYSQRERCAPDHVVTDLTEASRVILAAREPTCP